MHIEPDRFYTFSFICQYWGGDDAPLSRATLYRQIKAGQHPRQVKIGSLSRFWGQDIIDERGRRIAAAREAA